MPTNTPKPEENEGTLTHEEWVEALKEFFDDNDRLPEPKELACHALGEDDPSEEQVKAAEEALTKAVADDHHATMGTDLEEDDELPPDVDDEHVVIEFALLLRLFGSITDWSPAPEVFSKIAETCDSKARGLGFRGWHEAYRFMANNEWVLERQSNG